MALTPDQATELDAAQVGLIVNAVPSGDQTPAQARALAVESFRQACNWEGVGMPSAADVEAAALGRGGA